MTSTPVVYTSPEWCSLALDDDLHLSFQRSAEYRDPTWPDPHSSMQYHLHLRVADLEAEAAVLTLGATRFPQQPSPDTARVLADPVGHVGLVPARWPAKILTIMDKWSRNEDHLAAPSS